MVQLAAVTNRDSVTAVADPPVDEVAAVELEEPQQRRRWTRRRTILCIVVALLAVPLWSYGHVLTASSTDSVGVRSVEWLRTHGGAGIVNTVERWWYSHHEPKKGGPPAAVLTHPSNAATSTPAPPHATPAPRAESVKTAPVLRLAPPATLTPLAGPPLPAEGVWHPVGRAVDGTPAVYATALRPDAVHTSLATGVAWIDTSLLRGVLFAGRQLPGGTWANEAPIPLAERPALVAAFNSGFQLGGSRGGYYAEGRTVRPLVNGAASLVIDSQGRPTVGVWGRDVGMGPGVASVRQNLSLIVDGGRPVDGLPTNANRAWGTTVGNGILVWRSGVGETANGALVYAAGNGLSVASLARVLADAGAVHAMELDINSTWTRFFSYAAPDPAQPANVVGTKLTPDMRSAPTLYLEPETRDFFAFFAR